MSDFFLKKLKKNIYITRKVCNLILNLYIAPLRIVNISIFLCFAQKRNDKNIILFCFYSKIQQNEI